MMDSDKGMKMNPHLSALPEGKDGREQYTLKSFPETYFVSDTSVQISSWDREFFAYVFVLTLALWERQGEGKSGVCLQYVYNTLLQ